MSPRSSRGAPSCLAAPGTQTTAHVGAAGKSVGHAKETVVQLGAWAWTSDSTVANSPCGTWAMEPVQGHSCGCCKGPLSGCLPAPGPQPRPKTFGDMSGPGPRLTCTTALQTGNGMKWDGRATSGAQTALAEVAWGPFLSRGSAPQGGGAGASEGSQGTWGRGRMHGTSPEARDSSAPRYGGGQSEQPPNVGRAGPAHTRPSADSPGSLCRPGWWPGHLPSALWVHPGVHGPAGSVGPGHSPQ